MVFFFFKQKTAYEMRISDWSSDVCSSDLQIVQRFGTDMVAEVTGRSRRIVRYADILRVESRAGSANLAETKAFMDDEKRILVFSDAAGTGRRYHADLRARKRRLRAPSLLAAGRKAETDAHGPGHPTRPNQDTAP